jgi:hypothetical protein
MSNSVTWELFTNHLESHKAGEYLLGDLTVELKHLLDSGDKRAYDFIREVKKGYRQRGGMHNPIYNGTYRSEAGAFTTYHEPDDTPWLYSGLEHLIDNLDESK